MPRQEFNRKRREIQPPEHDGRADREPAVRRALLLRHRGLDVRDMIRDRLARVGNGRRVEHAALVQVCDDVTRLECEPNVCAKRDDAEC